MRDNSQHLSYRCCPLQYHLKYDVGLEKIQEGETEHHRGFGGAIHVGLEYWHKGATAETAIAAFKEAYPEQLDESDLAKTQANGVTLLEAYFSRYKTDLEKYEIMAVEEKIEFEVERVPFVVKVDTVVKDRKYGNIYGLENKTTKKPLTYVYWSQYEPNSQLVAQTVGIKKRFGECAGIIVNAMSCGYRQRAYKGEAAGFHMDFGRMEYNINDTQIGLWKKSVVATERHIQSDYLAESWAMNTSQCWQCSYKPICSAAWSWPQDQELILLNYKVNENPLAYLEPAKI